MLSTVAAAALVLAPGAWSGVLSGTQFSMAQAIALVAVGAALLPWLLIRPTRGIGARTIALLVVLAIVKVGLGRIDQPLGWRGAYTMLAPEPPAVAQFVWRLGVRPYRIDAQPGAASGLPFLNDFHRYNGVQYAPPRSIRVPLRFVWTGWFDAGDGVALEIRAHSAAATIRVDDRVVAQSTADAPLMQQSVDVGAGWHHVEIQHDKAAGAAPDLFAAVLLDGRPVAVRPSPAHPPVSSRVLATLSDVITAAGLLWWLVRMGVLFVTGRVRGGASRIGVAITGVATVALLVSALAYSSAFDRSYELRPGDDHLAYEGLARNILLEGVLMPEGRAPGQGTPFYFYPLYSYVLAALHLALGDTYAVVVLLNAVAASVLPALFWLLGWRHLGAGAQALGQAALVAFVLRHDARYWESPLTDNLFIPLALATLALAVRAIRTQHPAHAFATGAGIAAGATTRPSFFLFVGPLLLVQLWTSAGRRLGSRLAAPLSVVLGYVVALSPVVVRNWIMARRAVAMVTLSHAIPISLVPPESQYQVPFPGNPELYSWSASLALAGQLIAADPIGVAWLELRKILFTLGLTNLGPGNPPLVPEFPLLCVLAIVAVVRRRLPRDLVLVLGAFVLSHLAAVVIAYPWTYGYKTILPVHLVFLFCAAHLAGRARASADVQ